MAATGSWFQRRGRTRAWLESQLRDFGRPVDRDRDLTRLGALHRSRQADQPSLASVDERTWADLDMDLVFAALDRTASQAGAQVLYDRLRRPAEASETLDALDRMADALREDATMRARLVRDLMPLREWHTSYLAGLFWDVTPSPHRLGPVLPVLGLLPLAFALGAFVMPRLLILAILAALANVWMRIAMRSAIDPFVPGLRALPAFVRVATGVASQPLDVGSDLRDMVRRHLPALRFLKGAVRWIVFETDQPMLGPLAELAASFQEYANTVLLLDLNAFHVAALRIRAHRAELREAFIAIGTLDVALAVASVRAGAGERWTRPVFEDGSRRLVARGLVHPLLEAPVPNDVVMDGRSWLVTGSNMSGKSTLLRTVGVNALLARTIGTVLGTWWHGPPFTIRTCIGRGDSIVSGKSYYLAEAEAVRDLLRASEETTPHLFILDELFRGTNTVERIAAGRGVLEYLDRSPHLVLVATHDIELVQWLGDRYASLHFREQVADGELTFDYLLKPGVSSTRNAIALLEVLSYPEAVIEQARATVVEREQGTS